MRQDTILHFHAHTKTLDKRRGLFDQDLNKEISATMIASKSGMCLQGAVGRFALAAMIVASNTIAPSLSAVVVPDRLQLSPTLQSHPMGNIRLRALDLSTNPVKESSESLLLSDVAQNQSGSIGSVAFVVRRPGCSLCREHGLQVNGDSMVFYRSGM